MVAQNEDKVTSGKSRLDVDGLPEGVKAFVKENVIPANTPFRSTLYRVIDPTPPKTRVERAYLERLENDFYEDDYGEEYIKQTYGGGVYQAFITWKDKEKKKNEIQLERICIDGPPKLATVPKAVESPASAQVPPGGTGRPTEAPGAGLLEKVLKHLPEITACATAIKALIPKPDTSIIEKLTEAKIRSFERLEERVEKARMDMLKKDMEQLEEQPEETEENLDTVNGGAWPEWLQPFAPLITQYAGKLLGDDPVATGLQKIVVNSADFKKCWNNKERKAEAIKALTKHLGAETAASLAQTFSGLMEKSEA